MIVDGKAFPHVLTALINKRREIAGQIEDLQRQMKLAVTELDNVEATIRIFKPDIDMSDFGPRPVPPPHAAFKGEMSRILIDALRASPLPLTTRQLTEIVMKERGLPIDHIPTRRIMQGASSRASETGSGVRACSSQRPGRETR